MDGRTDLPSPPAGLRPLTSPLSLPPPRPAGSGDPRWPHSRRRKSCLRAPPRCLSTSGEEPNSQLQLIRVIFSPPPFFLGLIVLVLSILKPRGPCLGVNLPSCSGCQSGLLPLLPRHRPGKANTWLWWGVCVERGKKARQRNLAPSSSSSSSLFPSTCVHVNLGDTLQRGSRMFPQSCRRLAAVSEADGGGLACKRQAGSWPL